MKAPKTITESEITTISNFLLKLRESKKRRFKHTRDYCIFCFLLEAGLRVSECSKLMLKHIYFGSILSESIVVTPEISKNGNKRTIPISDTLKEAILSMSLYWFDTNLPLYSTYCFTDRPHGDKLTTRQIQRIISNAALLSIGRTINPHMLRHTFASRLMKITNIRVVQELLGHANIQTTQIYTHPDEQDKSQAIKSIRRHDFNVKNSTPENAQTSLDVTRKNTEL